MKPNIPRSQGRNLYSHYRLADFHWFYHVQCWADKALAQPIALANDADASSETALKAIADRIVAKLNP